MSQLMIIADSSSTIQKVIKITLSEGPYDVETCNNVEELIVSVSSGIKATVILDSQFAEEGCVPFVNKLQDINNNLVFIILYTARDAELIQSLAGFSTCEFIEKPFEAEELMAKCKILAPKGYNDETEKNSFSAGANNEWKIAVPGVIGHVEQEKIDIPDIISSSGEDEHGSINEFQKVDHGNEENQSDDFEMDDRTQEFSITDFANAKFDNQNQFPGDSDLEFPDASNKPKFESLDNLNLEDDEATSSMPGLQMEEIDDDEIEEGNWTSNDASTFWTPDSNTKERDLEDLDNEFKQNEFFAVNSSDTSQGDVNQVMEQMKPIIEKMIQEHCHQAVEKIAWEVIPDLAENLIRSELKAIKEQVLQDS